MNLVTWKHDQHHHLLVVTIDVTAVSVNVDAVIAAFNYAAPVVTSVKVGVTASAPAAVTFGD